MTVTPEPTPRTDAAETAESAVPENVGGLSGHELLSRTAVVVVSYDSAALLERTLARVAEDSPEARIIVVDNYSTPAVASGPERSSTCSSSWGMTCARYSLRR